MNVPIEIVAVFLTVFFSFIGTALLMMINAFKKNTNAFKDVGDAIQDIRIWMTKKDTSEVFEDKECAARHSYINEKFAKHSDTLQKHEIRITKLEK